MDLRVAKVSIKAEDNTRERKNGETETRKVSLRAASPDIIAIYSGPTMVKLQLQCN